MYKAIFTIADRGRRRMIGETPARKADDYQRPLRIHEQQTLFPPSDRSDRRNVLAAPTTIPRKS